MRLITFLCWACLLPSGLMAKVPEVVTDIAPVHSLVARVMQGVGAPRLIVRSGASPHEYALRPSEAAALQRADLVIWMGPELTPWLQGSVDTLAGDAAQMALLAADQTIVHPFRQGARFEAKDHVDAGHDHDHDHDHDHEGVDPHAWLDPVNGQIWLRLIADELSALDPENASIYLINATEGVAELDQVRHEIEEIMAPLRGIKYLVYHDAYQYFEARFDMSALGAISDSHASMPGPVRIAELRRFVAEEGLTCLLYEPQTDPRLMRAIFPQGAKVGILDPMGSDKQLGAGLYPALLLNLARGYEDCVR